MIPFVDLNRQYLKFKVEIDAAIAQTFEECRFILGSAVDAFESSLADYLGVRHVISCGSGTDALELILRAYGIGQGDEVIVPTLTWVSNAEAVCNVGAIPVFADVKQDSFNLDSSLLEGQITKNTKAIMAVHLYGLSCDMEAILAIAGKYDIKVIEDVAQALGSEFNGKKLGAIGHAAAHSFYPTKNLGAYGDAGAVSTNDAALAEKIRLITNHGQTSRDVHVMNGRNSRMDTIQAAILNVKLKYLNEMNALRRVNAQYYSDQLEHTDLKLPIDIDASNHSNHIYAIRSDRRNDLKNYLASNGITTAVHYPTALPEMKPYTPYTGNTRFGVAHVITEQELSLPIFPELTIVELEKVVKTIQRFLSK